MNNYLILLIGMFSGGVLGFILSEWLYMIVNGDKPEKQPLNDEKEQVLKVVKSGNEITHTEKDIKNLRDKLKNGKLQRNKK